MQPTETLREGDAKHDDRESPHRMKSEAWEELADELGVPGKAPSGGGPGGSRRAAHHAGGRLPADPWPIAMHLKGHLGAHVGGGKYNVLCMNDSAHSTPDGTATNAGGSCVLLPPLDGQRYGLPLCSHAHCAHLKVAEWRAFIGPEAWARAEELARAGAAAVTTEKSAAADTATDTASWPAPTPLDAPPAVPPFPVEVLSPWVRDFIDAAADVLQVPPDLPGQLVMPMLAAAMAHRCKFSPWLGWEEHPALYAMAVLRSGENKSAVVSALTRPIVDLEHETARKMDDDIRKARSAHDTATRRVNFLRDAVAKGKATRGDLDVAERELAGIAVPTAPRLVGGGDTTPEALAILLAAQGERMLVAAAEGGAVDDLIGLRYSKAGVMSLDLVLRAHDGDRLTVDRVGRPSLTLRAPLLGLALAVQPDVLLRAAERPELMNRGVIPRMLICWPDSRVGHRVTTARAWPDGVREAYDRCMRELWSMPVARDAAGDVVRHVVTLTASALELFVAWRDDMETLRRSGSLFSEPSGLIAWSSKLDGTCVRIAGILHVADRVGGGEPPLGGDISADTLTRAIRVCDYLSAHAIRAFAAVGRDDPAMDDAVAILATLRNHRATNEVSTREAQRMRHGCTAERAEAAMSVLVERGWAREKPVPPRSGPGRPPAKVYEVHPVLSGTTNRSRESSVNIVDGLGRDARTRVTREAVATGECVNIVDDSAVTPTATPLVAGHGVPDPGRMHILFPTREVHQ